MIRSADNSTPAPLTSWAWLAFALPLLFFSNGRWVVPAAAWWAPVFLQRFLRTQRAPVGILAGLAASVAVAMPAWAGMIPVPGRAYYLVAGVIAATFFIPYVLDRLIAPRIGGFASSLVLPLAWTSVEWLSSTFGPYGTWGSLAYTQHDNLPLLQLMSVTGMSGVVFLVAWFAGVVNWAWERRFEWKRVRGGALLYAAVVTAVLFIGGLRLVAFPPRGPAVRVAGITVVPDPGARRIADQLQRSVTDPELKEIRRQIRALQDTLLAHSAREARAGAGIVVWSECNGWVLKSDEPAFIQRGRDLARRQRIWLFMALVTLTPGKPLHENQLVAVRPDGSVAFRYHKARPVPGDRETGADRRIPAPVESRFGDLTGAICFDMDFPGLIRRAGREGTDLLLVPSSDWRAIDPLHTRMAIYRGIENGCAVVRQVNQGLSAAADHQGRILAAADYFKTADHAMVAQVPTRGVRTIYSRIGNLFAWACLGGLLAFAAAAALNPVRAR